MTSILALGPYSFLKQADLKADQLLLCSAEIEYE
jgi:hypothetical protein